MKKFVTPELEVEKFDVEDVITTSIPTETTEPNPDLPMDGWD